MATERRQYSTKQKADLVLMHLIDKTPVSEICNRNQLQPSVFYQWIRQLRENAPAAFSSPRASSHERQLEQKVKSLEEKLARKDEVIAEVTEEFVKAKKSAGEP